VPKLASDGPLSVDSVGMILCSKPRQYWIEMRIVIPVVAGSSPVAHPI